MLSPHSRVNVSVCRVRTTTSVPIDPFQPVLSTMPSDQVLKVIGNWNILRFSSSEEVLSNRICVVSKGDFDRTFEPVNVRVVAGSLVSFMLSHQWKELLGSPPFGLKIIIV